ncbi:hypothetical protein B0H13DRAFT_2669455 [Mycena leptocephala]|nr:hypothetical protein B0H13DRAFT_2669455 [Mycena leptocephala]
MHVLLTSVIGACLPPLSLLASPRTTWTTTTTNTDTMNVNGHHSQANHTQAYQRLARSPNPTPAQGTPSSFAQRQAQMYSALSQQQALAAQADISTIAQRMQDLDELVQRHQEAQPAPDALTAEQRKVYEYIWAQERAANRNPNPNTNTSFTAHGGHAHAHPQAYPHQVRTQSSTQVRTQAAATSYPTLNPSSGAKWIKPLTQARLGQFNGGHFGDVNLGAVLYERKEDSEEYVKMEVWSAPALTKPSFAEAMSHSSEFKPAHKGDVFGPSWSNHWFKITLKVPESDFGKYERVTFEFDPGCEAMIIDTSGTPLQGITGGYAGDRRVEYIIPPSARKKGEHEIVVESSACLGWRVGGSGRLIPTASSASTSPTSYRPQPGRVAPPVGFHDAEGAGGYVAGEYAVRSFFLPVTPPPSISFSSTTTLFRSRFVPRATSLCYLSFRFRSRRCGTRRNEILVLEGDARASVPATERAKSHRAERSAYTAACDEDTRGRGHRICEETAVYG